MLIRERRHPYVFRGVTDVTDCKTSREVLIKSNLDWDIKTGYLYGEANNIQFENKNSFLDNGKQYIKCEEHYCTYRTDTNQILGVVKGKYTPLQNRDAFDFFDNIIIKGDSEWFTAGCYNNGRKVFITAKINKTFKIANANDDVDNYLMFITSHDGSTGVKVLLTPIRVVCFNMLNAAISSSTKYFNFKHTESVHYKIEKVQDMFKSIIYKIDTVKEYYQKLYNTKVTDEAVANIICAAILNENEYNQIELVHSKPMQLALGNYVYGLDISAQKRRIIGDMFEYYNIGIGQKEIIGTGWGLYNAISGYYSNVDNTNGIRRMDNFVDGRFSNKIKEVGELIVSAA